MQLDHKMYSNEVEEASHVDSVSLSHSMLLFDRICEEENVDGANKYTLDVHLYLFLMAIYIIERHFLRRLLYF